MKDRKLSFPSKTPSGKNQRAQKHCQTAIILEPISIPSHIAKSKEVILSNEYEKSNTCKDLEKLLKELSYNVKLVEISLLNYTDIINDIFKLMSKEEIVVFNLCDGCGVSVLRLLSRHNIPFTGASCSFYEITTSKPLLKQYLIKNNVPTSPFLEITKSTTEEDINALGYYPLIVKPSISYASISISYSSVVFNAQDALKQARKVIGVDEGVFVEKFLEGREFTAFVVGSKEEGVFVHQVAERVFNTKLSKYERILAFDKYWEGYDVDGSKPDNGGNEVYKYAPAPDDIQDYLKRIAKDAYLAVEGSGYGRVDMRESNEKRINDGLHEVYVLEVNANCGVSFNPMEFTSTVGEILRMSGESVYDFANDLIDFAVKRSKRLNGSNQVEAKDGIITSQIRQLV